MESHMEGKVQDILDEVGKVIRGKDEAISLVLTAILARGHILIEDIPGVGKTTLAVAFSRAMELTERRLQFTPDVLPSDVVGFNMLDADGEMQYKPGAILCNLLLADEINRTSPKTQSALLEVMEEGTVTVDGVTRQVPRPFIVLATQNPVGSFGTQRLPEAQMDRFLICVSMGYPDLEDEIAMVKSRHRNRPLDQVQPVISGEELLDMQEETENIFIHDALYKYMTLLARDTRENEHAELGLSPRGTLALGKMARAYAYIRGRSYCVPKDIKAALYDVGIHRIRLSQKARINGKKPEDILEEALAHVREPRLGERV